MKILLIAAHDPNLVIGNDGKLPWHYSADLKFFKNTTMGHTLLMGRIVFEELNEKPLPGREAVVLSRKKEYNHVPVYRSVEEALSALQKKGIEKLFIIGGGEIYRQTIEIAEELIITEIKKEYDGDTYFPEYRDQIGKTWIEIWRESHQEFDFVKYIRSDTNKNL